MATSYLTYGLIAIGGALGAIARYSVGLWCMRLAGSFPYGTLTVNVVGSFIIGIAFCVLSHNHPLRLLVIVGFLGAFTTFSSFSLETLQLLQNMEVAKAILNIFFNLSLCLLGVWLGWWLFKGWLA